MEPQLSIREVNLQMENKQIKLLTDDQALKKGADLWVLSEQKYSHQWNVKIDWYMNFLITKSYNKNTNSLHTHRKNILKKYHIQEFQPSLKSSLKNIVLHTSPLLIKSSPYLPNLLVLVVNYHSNWLNTIYNIWFSLKKPSLRIFAPKSVTIEILKNVWQNKSFNLIQYVQD